MPTSREPLAIIWAARESDDGNCDRCGRKAKVGVEIELTGSRYDYCCESCVTRQLIATSNWREKQASAPAIGKPAESA